MPASGYFEWTGPKNDRQPHYFTRADGQPMALAGLWDRWRSKDKSETKETFTIVTTEPSKFAAQFHNRMPVVLEPDTWDLWMKGEPDAAAALMKPANEDVLVSRPVSKAVGNVKNNGPELLTLILRPTAGPGLAPRPKFVQFPRVATRIVIELYRLLWRARHAAVPRLWFGYRIARLIFDRSVPCGLCAGLLLLVLA